MMAVLDTVHAESAQAEGAQEEAADDTSDVGAGTGMELGPRDHVLVTGAATVGHWGIMPDGGYSGTGLNENLLSHNCLFFVMCWLAHGLWGRRLVPNFDLTLWPSIGRHVSRWNVSGRCLVHRLGRWRIVSCGCRWHHGLSIAWLRWRHRVSLRGSLHGLRDWLVIVLLLVRIHL